ncbi:hypothetical protein ZWY2020_046840 [Hordeum vulgare]|nr:hypothetical protein ZWY2020_046840 [Hordeum vulgare]
MAASILSHVVSDLCIGKSAVRVLPSSTPIAAALATLRAGADPFIFVDAAPPDVKKTAALSVVVKVSVAEILCYVCGDTANLGDPAAALRRPVSVLTAVVGDHGVTRRVDPQTSLLDAIDVVLANNSHSLVVPLHAGTRKKHHHVWSISAGYCVLTQQDIVRHLFGSISSSPRSPRFPCPPRHRLHAMCDLMDAAYATDAAALSSSSTSSDEECLPLAPARRARKMSSGSFRWRSTEDVAACHAESSLVAVMAQALAHRVGHVWVVDEVSGALVGVVSCADVLAVLRDHLRPECYADDL